MSQYLDWKTAFEELLRACPNAGFDGLLKIAQLDSFGRDKFANERSVLV